MNEDLISRGALLADIQTDVEDGGVSGMVAGALRRYVRRAHVVDAVSKEEYEHLLKIATKMHTWIFLNTFDELAVYDELGLTDEDNTLLGYGGQFVIEEKEG